MEEYYEKETEKIEEYLRRLGYAEGTIKSYIINLNYFFKWIKTQEMQEITQKTITKYNNHIHKKAIKRETINNKLNVLKLYDKYLQKIENKKLLTERLETLETSISIKKPYLSQKEIKKIYEETEETLKGYLERALLALYYGCGLRGREGENLTLEDINQRSNIIHIKPGKNYRNRYIPMSKKVKTDLLNYIKYSRPYLSKNSTTLLINKTGTPMRSYTARLLIKSLAEKAGIKKQINLHILRHSIATHLLEGGMQLEQIAQFLGHQSLQTTQIYTHIL